MFDSPYQMCQGLLNTRGLQEWCQGRKPLGAALKSVLWFE
jgi:hypothetical protein